jgi:crotonobetainyl-CoA:carnitine CoA-transferase CaiB-like acyl-CoA transferase
MDGGGGPMVFQGSDGRWLHILRTPRFLPRVTKALGLEGAAGQEDLHSRVAALIRTRPAGEWERVLADAACAVSLCNTAEDWLHHPHAHLSGAVTRLEDPEFGPMAVPGIPVRIDGAGLRITEPRHALDADREAVLADTAAERQRPVAAAAESLPLPLEGLTVLDVTQVLAGPGASRFLAEFGARVIKINNPRGDLYEQQHTFLNRGKESMLLDLTSPAGLDVFYRLAGKADIVMQNFAKGVAERMGLGYDDLRRLRPDVIYYSLSCFGYGGPLEGQRGHEPQGQSCAGLSERFGGDGMPVSQPLLVNDYGTAPLGAFAVALAFLNRMKTGSSQHAQASLVQTATFHQTPYAFTYPGKIWDEPRGQDQTGYGPLDRLFAARDGRVFVACRQSQLDALGKALDVDLDGLSGAALERTLEESIAARTAGEAVSLLTAAGVAAHALQSVEEFAGDPLALARGNLLVREHAGQGLVRTAGPVVRMSGTPLRSGRPAPPAGSDGPAIVRELGLDPERLLREGVLVESREIRASAAEAAS